MNSNITSALMVAALATLPHQEAKEALESLGLSANGSKKPNTLLAEAIANGKARLAITVDIKPQYPDLDNPDIMMESVHKSRVYTYKERKTASKVV
jgi:hypothetical protein